MCFFLAKCCTNTFKNAVRVNVPRLKFDKLLNMHFRENDEFMVRDASGECQMGDWILIKKMDVKKAINIDHELYRIVYKHGNLVCPLTQKKSYGYMFKEDYEKFNVNKSDNEDNKSST